MVFRLRSSSTLILLATLSSPQEFVRTATRDTAFWSFILAWRRLPAESPCGLPFVASPPAVGNLPVFLNYPLVAALHGYPEWFFGDAVLPVQDAMISYLSLLSYATALWLHSEVFDLKTICRAAPAAARCYWRQYCASRQRSLGFYGLAMQIEAAMFFIAAPILLITSWLLWRRKAIDLNTLLLGLLPPVYVASAALVLLDPRGDPFHNTIYSAWQYALIVHIVTVLIIAVLRVRAENRRLVQKQQLTRELQIEREASFHQRQFMGMVAHEFRTPLGYPGRAGEPAPVLSGAGATAAPGPHAARHHTSGSVNR
jgi:hypothetical protein